MFKQYEESYKTGNVFAVLSYMFFVLQFQEENRCRVECENEFNAYCLFFNRLPFQIMFESNVSAIIERMVTSHAEEMMVS